MAKQSNTRSQTSKKKNVAPTWLNPLHTKNLMLLVLGVGVIILGFILMSTGITSDPTQQQTTWNSTLSTSIAPIILVIGYCIIIPYAILKYFPSQEETTSQQD